MNSIQSAQKLSFLQKRQPPRALSRKHVWATDKFKDVLLLRRRTAKNSPCGGTGWAENHEFWRKWVLVHRKSILRVSICVFSIRKSRFRRPFVSETLLFNDFWRFSEIFENFQNIQKITFFKIAKKSFWTGQKIKISILCFFHVCLLFFDLFTFFRSVT